MRHNNSFGFLRFVAASMVVSGHAAQVATNNYDLDWLHRLTKEQMFSGAFAVMIFFALSGYLVTGSWENRPKPLSFLWARFLRIWPALTVVVLLTVFVFGPLVTTDPHYWANPMTWHYLTLLGLHSHGTDQVTLPRVFETTPLKGAVNGPLWTLQYEMFCYLALCLLGALRLLERRSILAMTILMLVLAWRIPGFIWQPWVYMTLPFFVGSTLYAWRDRVHWTWLTAALAALALIVSIPLNQFNLLAPVCGGFLALYFGRKPWLARFERAGDPSYGIYLYHFPLLQLAEQHGLRMPWQTLPLVYPLAVGLGYLSWHLIEKGPLQLKNKVPFGKYLAHLAPASVSTD